MAGSDEAPARQPDRPHWKRVILKLSGEALAEPSGFGLDTNVLRQVALEIKDVRDNLHIDIAVVVGGGNFWRGLKGAGQGMDQAQADFMGMIATVMNGLALQDALERVGQYSRVMTAVEMPKVAEPYIRRRAERHMEKGRVVIFAGGTGNPFFTTDTAASLRAIEINADILVKATKVNGIYSADPMKDPKAVRYPRLTFDRVLDERLNVMDATSIVMCRDNKIPLQVYNMNNAGDLLRIARGEDVGTVVTND